MTKTKKETGGKRKEAETVEQGYPRRDVKAIKAAKWWCGDYACDSGGTIYNSGDVQRICFPEGSACPATTTLGDGSKWTLSGGCRQDG